MGHTHAEDRGTYYKEQLCTIGICGMLGIVTILLYSQNILRFILADYLHVYVLASGIALLAIVALRAVGLWRSVGTQAVNHDHTHEHEHGEDHDHAHEDLHAEEGHGHDCAHDHVHGQGHDCGHEHTWNPVRYIVLLLPIALYFLHLPNAGFSASGVSISLSDLDQGTSGKYVENTGLQVAKDNARDLLQVVSVVADGPAAKAGVKPRDLITEIKRKEDSKGKSLAQPEVVSLKGLSVDDAIQKLKGKPGSTVVLTLEHPEDAKLEEVTITRSADVIPLDFGALQGAAYTPSSRQYYEGKIVQLIGQYAPGGNDRNFTLVRFKITCCAADARKLDVVIALDPQASGDFSHIKALEWVKVTGRITFYKRKDRDEYVTGMVVASPNDVKSTDPDPRPYIQ